MELSPRNGFVALLQSESTESDNKYRASLERVGLKARSVPTISFTFVNTDALKRSLDRPDDYSGIVFSSARAVEAVGVALDSRPLDRLWKSKFCFSVGEATSKAALSQLNLQTYGSDSGNSTSLCEAIVEKCRNSDKPLIFPCSNLRRGTIPDTLPKHNVPLQEIVCYETVLNPHFKDQWHNLTTTEGLPDVVVFFSPSGVKNCLKTVLESYTSDIKPKFVALGPSTQNELKDNGVAECSTAKKPNPECVLNAVKELLNL